MPISSGTVSKGEKGKPKFQTLNLNNVFSQSKGESSKPNQQKALFNKHGMSVLGKVPSARKPLNLPSLKSESTGNEPPINLVPTGGSGWGNKPGETGPPPATVVTTPPITTINTSVPPPPIVDKSWSAKIAGKPSNPPNYNSTHQSPLFNQEFPSLSGSGNTDAQYGPGPSLRPQTEGSWIQGGSHPTTGGEVGNLQGTVPAQDLPTETLRPEVAAILPSFMMKQETQFTSFSNPPPRVAHRFSSHPPNHDNRFMQHPPPLRNKDHVHCAIVKEEELSKLDNVSKEGEWTLHDSVDYNQQLHFSDDEVEESENKENKNSPRFSEKSSAISENSSSHISDEQKLMKKKEYIEILEKAKVRKESEEQRFIESKMNAAKKLEALTKNIEDRKKEHENKDERKTTGQPVVKDGNEFRQLTQLSSDKPQSYKEPAYNFPPNNRFSTLNNKPPRLRKQEEMQHKGPYRSNQERNYFESDYDRDNRHRGEYNSRDRFNMNNSRDGRDYRNSGYDNRKFSDQKSNYNRDSDMKYQGRYSDSSDPSIDSRQRESWERETPKRKDSDRSKQSYEDENDRYRSDNDGREKNMKELNSWENDKHDDYDGRWGDHADYDREEGLWEKDRRLERPTRPDSRDSRASRESKTSHSDHNMREEKLNVIDDPEDNLERERKPTGFIKNTRGAGVPITAEKLEAAESKQDKSSVLVPLVRSDKSGDYKKDGKEEDKKQLDAWSTPLNKANFSSEQKKEEIPPGNGVKQPEPIQEKQSSEEPADKENKDRNTDRKEGKEANTKKERGDKDAHHRDRDRDRGGRGGSRYQQSSRSNEWSNNYSGGRDVRDRNWPREGKDPRFENRRGHGRAPPPPPRNSYSRHNRSESDPESGKEERYHEGTRERRVEKGRKERDDGWYNDRERFKEREQHYYDGRGSREYSQRGGSSYRSSNQSSGQGRRMEYASSSKNFSGDEKKPREKKEATSEDDKKEKKALAKPVGKSGREKNEKDWESDGRESIDDEKYKRGGSYSSRGSRGTRQTYSARKNEKFPKERPVKEENKEDVENAGEAEHKPKETGDSKPEHGFQEVKAKKAPGKETSAPKKVEEKNKQRDTAKATAAPKQSSASQGSKVNTSGKGVSQQNSGKATPGTDKVKIEATVNQQKKQENAIDESKIPSFSNAKDVMTGPPPPPPATNAWDRPLNAAALKSASPGPMKTSTPPPRPASSASSNAQSEPASHLSDETSQQQQQHQQQQYQQQQSLAEQQQQLQAQQLAAAQKQQQQHQVQQQTLDKIDTSLLDGTNTSVPTMLFENRNYKSMDYRPKETMTIEDYKQQQDLAIAKEDSSAADMKLDFTYGSDLSSGAEDHKNLVSHHHNLQHMVQSSAVELNWKIASVKSFWEEPEATKQGPDGMVNTFPVPHSGAGGHFSVVQTGAGVTGQDGSPVPSGATQNSGPGAYKTSSSSGGPGESDCGPSAAEVAELHGMYGTMGPRGMGQSAQQQAAVYANAMSVKEQQELAKLSKQQMAVAAQQAGSVGGAPTPNVMSTPPPPQQQAQAQQSYGPAPTHYAQTAHQFSPLPSQTATAAMLYSTTPLGTQSVATPFGNYSVDQTAQLLSSAQAPRQTATQYPFLNLGQTYNQSNMYIHQQSSQSPASELASQLSGGYRLTAGGPPTGYASTGAGLTTSGGPPSQTLYIQSAAAAVKSANSGVPPIGTKTGYQPSPQSQQMYIPANIYTDHTALMSQSYLSQTQQQRPAPTASSFYSTGTGGTAAQAASYYANTYTNSPYSLGYGAQSPAPSGAQQMSSVGMGKPVVSNKYSQPPPQASAQQAAQVKYASYQPNIVSQAQMIQNQQQVSQQSGGQQQQVLLTPAHQQQQSNQ